MPGTSAPAVRCHDGRRRRPCTAATRKIATAACDGDGDGDDFPWRDGDLLAMKKGGNIFRVGFFD